MATSLAWGSGAASSESPPPPEARLRLRLATGLSLPLPVALLSPCRFAFSFSASWMYPSTRALRLSFSTPSGSIFMPSSTFSMPLKNLLYAFRRRPSRSFIPRASSMQVSPLAIFACALSSAPPPSAASSAFPDLRRLRDVGAVPPLASPPSVGAAALWPGAGGAGGGAYGAAPQPPPRSAFPSVG